MLGSLSEVDDAVQEAWLRLSRTEASSIENLRGWLTTVIARVCLDMLRSRQSRREEPYAADAAGPPAIRIDRSNSPEQEALLADSVGLALLVVLDRLTPAERLAFVLHDMFAVPFEEIAPIIGRSVEAARQLASRARRRVRGGGEPAADFVRQREVVEAFMAALRAGDLEGLLAILDPNLVVRTDMPGAPAEIRGAAVWAKGAVAYGHLAQLAQLASVDGAISVVVAPQGRLVRALRFAFANGKITEIEVIASPDRLRELDVSIID
jgi:RNA polymerase sigma-70 factor, ECF subfamily